MKIAYISYEYPPDTAVGGIATYIEQIAVMMSGRGHHIEVFCGSDERTVTESVNGVLVHRLQGPRDDFSSNIVGVFSQRHAISEFDIFESPEYGGDGYFIKKAFPALPMVVKLHTPGFLIREISSHYQQSKQQKITDGVRALIHPGFNIGNLIGLIKQKLLAAKPRAQKLPGQDTERAVTLLADEIHSPSVSLGDIISERWAIPAGTIKIVPNAFIPRADFLSIPVKTDSLSVTYIGRLEVRKGVIELARAIPDVCRQYPQVKFNFIGKTLPSLLPGVTMEDYLREEIKEFKDNVSFKSVTPAEIPLILSQTDICIFPSIWENFPGACLEAMSAGRAIIAGKYGGMKDMLEDAEAGILIDPLSKNDIAGSIIKLLGDPALRWKLGNNARAKVLADYNQETIGKLLEERYLKTITRLHVQP